MAAELRASDTDRDRVADELRPQAGAGRSSSITHGQPMRQTSARYTNLLGCLGIMANTRRNSLSRPARTHCQGGLPMDTLYLLALLACPIGMGAMMWFMNHGQHGSTNARSSGINQEQELARLRAEVDTLRAQQDTDNLAPVNLRVSSRLPGRLHHEHALLLQSEVSAHRGSTRRWNLVRRTPGSSAGRGGAHRPVLPCLDVSSHAPATRTQLYDIG